MDIEIRTTRGGGVRVLESREDAAALRCESIGFTMTLADLYD